MTIKILRNERESKNNLFYDEESIIKNVKTFYFDYQTLKDNVKGDYLELVCVINRNDDEEHDYITHLFKNDSFTIEE